MTSSGRDAPESRDAARTQSRRDDHDHDDSAGTTETTAARSDVAQYAVPEMDCPSCAGKVENSVRKLDGITAVDPQITTGTLTVSHDPEETTPDAIADRIERAGYTVEHRGETTATFTVP